MENWLHLTYKLRYNRKSNWRYWIRTQRLETIDSLAHGRETRDQYKLWNLVVWGRLGKVCIYCSLCFLRFPLIRTTRLNSLLCMRFAMQRTPCVALSLSSVNKQVECIILMGIMIYTFGNIFLLKRCNKFLYNTLHNTVYIEYFRLYLDYRSIWHVLYPIPTDAYVWPSGLITECRYFSSCKEK